jgi:uncharacterized membrane protein
MFEHQMITEMVRVALGVLCGLVMLSIGEFLHVQKKYLSYALSMTGGGLAMLYLTAYAAYGFYHLIGQSPAYVLMILTTAVAVFFSFHYDCEPIAIIGCLGGFATPALLHGDTNQYLLLLGYISILAIGFFIVAGVKSWQITAILNVICSFVLAMLGKPATYAYMFELFPFMILIGLIVFGLIYYRPWAYLGYITLALTVWGGWIWAGDNYNSAYLIKRNLTALITVLFLLYNFGFALRSLFKKEKFDTYAVIFQSLNGMTYFCAIYLMYYESNRDLAGYIAVGLALYYLVFARMNRTDELLKWTQLGLSSLFVTVALPILLNKHWITFGWMVEAVVLTWLGILASSRILRYGSLSVLVLGIFRLLACDSFSNYYLLPEYTPVLNWRFLAFGSVVAASYGILAMHRIHRDKLHEKEINAIQFILLLLGNVITLWLLSIECLDFVDFHWGYQRASLMEARNLAMLEQMTLSCLLSLYAVCLVVIGMVKRVSILRMFGIVLFGITILKVFLSDLNMLQQLYRVISFIVLGIILLGISYLYQRFREKFIQFIKE